MANDLNKCSFIGRLGAEPETRYGASGDALCSFSIAVGSQWKNKQGDKQEATEWVNITAFGKLGEICAQWLHKGSQIYVDGRMKTEKYQAKDGTDRYSTKIIADNMQMLGGKPIGDQESGRPAPASSAQPAATTSKPGTGQGFDDFDDSVPF
jgi:single-strand DNA-binding protein